MLSWTGLYNWNWNENTVKIMKFLGMKHETSSLKTEETAESNDFVMTPKEVAQFTKFSEKKIYRLCKSNEIPFNKIGGQYRFIRTDIERWLKGE
ncbi:MAG: helix-turn-helix domain-containing protein [Pseudobdellovibrio sp.]